jgi:hypothetical protein
MPGLTLVTNVILYLSCVKIKGKNNKLLLKLTTANGLRFYLKLSKKTTRRVLHITKFKCNPKISSQKISHLPEKKPPKTLV